MARNFDQTVEERTAPASSARAGSGRPAPVVATKVATEVVGASPPSRPLSQRQSARALASSELDEPKSDSTWYDANSVDLLDEAEVAELLREFGGDEADESRGPPLPRASATAQSSAATDQYLSAANDDDLTLSNDDTGRRDLSNHADDDDPTLNDDAETLNDVDDHQDDEPGEFDERLDERLDDESTYASAVQALQPAEVHCEHQATVAEGKGKDDELQEPGQPHEISPPNSAACATPGVAFGGDASECVHASKARNLNCDAEEFGLQVQRSAASACTPLPSQKHSTSEPAASQQRDTRTLHCCLSPTDQPVAGTIELSPDTNHETIIAPTSTLSPLIADEQRPVGAREDPTQSEERLIEARRFSVEARARHEAMYPAASLKSRVSSASTQSLNGLLSGDCPLEALKSRHLVKAAKKCSRLYEELERLLAARAASANPNRTSASQSAPMTAASGQQQTAKTKDVDKEDDEFNDNYGGDDDDEDDDGDVDEEEESVITSDQSSLRDDQISLSSSSLSSETLPEIKQRKNLQRLYNIVNEICTSEEKFVDTLRLLNVDFREHICNSANPNSGASGQKSQQQQQQSFLQQPPYDCVGSILKHLPQLQALNENLLDELRRARDQWPKTQKISHVLVKVGPFLKHYSSYIRDFELIQQQYSENLRKFPHFGQLIREFESREAHRCRNLSIQHHLLKPIQRIPQYRLLLQQYLHHLKPDDADYEDTVSALEVVSRVAEHANQSLSEGANFSKLLALQAKIVGKQRDIVQPGRLFVREGELLKVCRKQIQPRWLVLLSDSLLYLKQIQSSDILYLKYELPLNDCQVDVPAESEPAPARQAERDEGPAGAGRQAAGRECEFNVRTTVRSMTLVAKSRQERDEWVQTMRRTIEDHVAKRRSFKTHRSMQQLSLGAASEPVAVSDAEEAPISELVGRKAPIWTPDSRVTMCQLCTSNFSALFRRHHCRACGRVVCSACSSNKAPLIYLKCRAARVCDQCFDQLRANMHLYYLPSSQIDERELRRLDEHFKTLLKSQFVRHVMNSWISSSASASLSKPSKHKHKLQGREATTSAAETTKQT